MADHGSILLAEDDETDVLLLQRAIADVGITAPLHVVTDGQEAVDHLASLQEAPARGDRFPALILLDLKMPRMNGLDVLCWLRADPAMATVPVIVFTSSAHQHDVERAFAAGANAFVVKTPATSDRLEFARFIQSWLRFNQLPIVCSEGYRAAQTLHAKTPMIRPAQTGG